MKEELKPKLSSFFTIDNILIDRYARELGATATLLYICLKRYDNMGIAWPSYNVIARKLGICTKTVQRNIYTLQKYGLLRIVSKRNGGEWPNNNYHFIHRDKWVKVEPEDIMSDVATENHNRETLSPEPEDVLSIPSGTKSLTIDTNEINTYEKKTNPLEGVPVHLSEEEIKQRFEEIRKSLGIRKKKEAPS
jgi:hypothetical protein